MMLADYFVITLAAGNLTKSLVGSGRPVKVSATMAMAHSQFHLLGIFLHCLYEFAGQVYFLKAALYYPEKHQGFDFFKHILWV
jgi:hypothetical protein